MAHITYKVESSYNFNWPSAIKKCLRFIVEVYNYSFYIT